MRIPRPDSGRLQPYYVARSVDSHVRYQKESVRRHDTVMSIFSRCHEIRIRFGPLRETINTGERQWRCLLPCRLRQSIHQRGKSLERHQTLVHTNCFPSVAFSAQQKCETHQGSSWLNDHYNSEREEMGGGGREAGAVRVPSLCHEHECSSNPLLHVKCCDAT